MHTFKLLDFSFGIVSTRDPNASLKDVLNVVNTKVRRCGMTANETTRHRRLNDTEMNKNMSPSYRMYYAFE